MRSRGSSRRSASGEDDRIGPRRGGTTWRRAGSQVPASDSDSTSPAESFVDLTDLLDEADTAPRSISRLPRLLARCARLIWATDRRIFLTSTAMQLVTGGIVALQVLATKWVLQAFLDTQGGASVDRAVLPVLLLAAITAVTGIFAAIQRQQQRMLSELTTRATWMSILEVSSAVDLLSYEKPGFYDHLRRVQTNAIIRPYEVVRATIGLIGGLASTVGLAVAIVALQPLLLPLLALSGLPLWVSGRVNAKREFRFVMGQTPGYRMRDYLSRILSGRDEAKELRAFDFGEVLRGRYVRSYARYIAGLRVHLRKKSVVAVSGTLGSTVLLAITLAVLLWLIAAGSVGLAEAGAAIVAVRMLGSQITTLFDGVQQVFESSLFLGDLDSFLRLKPGEVPSNCPIAPSGFKRLEAEDIGFTYPGSSAPAVRDVSLAIDAGQVVALVGENGSGKTTVAKLLASLYVPSSGRITWDGVDISGYSETSVRAAIAILFQDFVRYELEARSNITAGRPNIPVDEEAVESAAKRVGADEFLSALPMGYETLLSKAFKGGRDLSVGQWQRVALARAFYRDAPFVILDEPTASMDPRAEAVLFEKIRELLAGRTVLLISHRFSSVRYADMIYVMKDGEIAERGTHEELMAREGLYAELFTLQAAAYVDSPAT